MKSPWPWITAAVLAALLLALPIGILRVQAFLSSEEFQKLAAHHAGSAIGGAAELTPIRWTGPTAFSDSLRIRGGTDSHLREIEARHLRVTWNWRSFFSGVWRIEEIIVESLRGTMGPPSGLDQASAPPSPAPSWASALLPKRFELGIVHIRHADLDFEGVLLRDAALEIRPDADAWAFGGSGGTLAVEHWPVLDVESFQARWAGDRLRIVSSSLRQGQSGHLSASGEWPGKIDLDGSGLALSTVLPPLWRDMLHGTLSGNASIAPLQTTGRFELTHAVLRSVVWLETLATLTGRADLHRLPIQKASGTFAFREDAWHWRDLVVESDGLLRIEGDLHISSDRHLSGEVRLGVASALLRTLPGAKEKVFTDSRDGFVWTPVSLGGTLDAPTENLTPRLAAAAGEKALEAVQPVLQAVPGRARDAVGETINTLFDLLGR